MECYENYIFLICSECNGMMAYYPEDVETTVETDDNGNFVETIEFVKCPNCGYGNDIRRSM